MMLRKLFLQCVGLGLVFGASAGSLCNPVSIFACDTDEACVAEAGEGAQCEANNYCTVPDESCMSTRRWHDRAASDLAGNCSGDGAGTGGGSAGSDSAGSGSSGSGAGDAADGSGSSGEMTAGTTATAGTAGQ